MSSYGKAFSFNIRRLRKERNMTQKMLAEAAGYSEKTISKWETDGVLPAIDTLFRVAGVLQVDLMTLFRDNTRMYYLGIDGGGTKTTFLLEDYQGQEIRGVTLSGCNPIDVGIEETKRILKEGIFQTCAGVPLSSVAVFAGLAGCSSGNLRDDLNSFLGTFSFAAYKTGSDNENIISAGLGERNGITMILGTGICSFAVRNQQYHRIAGWGYLFDEGGSAYNIGRDAVSSYYSAFDGSGEQTSLVRRIEETAGCAGLDLLKMLYDGGKKMIASYAPLVFEEADKGDAIAQGILARNIAEIIRILKAALRDFDAEDEPVPVVLAGGLTNVPNLLPMLLEALGDDSGRCSLQILPVSAAKGAVLLAKNLWEETMTHEP